jgi:predicted nucleotidyltransferase component of viral defense system
MYLENFAVGDVIQFPNSCSPVDLKNWRASNHATLEEARKRFVQFAILESIGLSPFSGSISFKGGNALRLIFQNPRGTLDLDFSADSKFPSYNRISLMVAG